MKPLREMPSIIAIDGPAGSGKSTLGKKLADCLGYLFFDTGVMYRAVTWAALQHGIAISDEAGVTRLSETIVIDVRPASVQDGRTVDVIVDGRDITWEARNPDVEDNVSVVSAYAGVRHALTAQQRRIGLKGNIVMAGRDIGTVVLPEAHVKLYLDASVEERARRRYQELARRGETVEFETILNALKARDKIDSTRSVAPLKPAEDAIIIDSNNLDANQVLEQVKHMIPGCSR